MKLRTWMAMLCTGMTIAFGAHAADTFDPKTGQITIESIVIGSVLYSNVVISLGGDFKVISVGGVAPVDPGPVAALCTPANFTAAKFNAIAVGMSLTQVNQIVGCQPDTTYEILAGGTKIYTWFYTTTRRISVYFDGTTSLVLGTGGKFKESAGF